MTTQMFDGIADQYQASKWLLFRHYVERHTMITLLGRPVRPDAARPGLR